MAVKIVGMDTAARLARSCDRWSLRLGERLSGGFRSEVYAAQGRGGEDLVLKLCPTRADWSHETAALRLWADSGASVVLLDADPAASAIVLERLRPGAPISRTASGSIGVAAELLARLHDCRSGGPIGGYGFLPLAGSFAEHRAQALDDLRAERRSRTEPTRASVAEQALSAAVRLGERLASDDVRCVLLHGDPLSKNLLSHQDGYRAIDPIPRLGDPGADAGMFAADRRAPMIIETADELARLLGQPPDRVIAWSVVWTVLQAVQAWRDDQDELDQLIASGPVQRLLRRG